MALIGGEIAYRFLRWYTRGGAIGDRGASPYSGESKLRVLLGDELLSEIYEKDVIDFGCGDGTETIEMATAGARSVVGVDIRTEGFPAALRRAAAAGLGGRVRFLATPDAPADVIVSLDTFEHFAAPAEILRIMASALRPGGRVFVSFGPPWYHPLGGHFLSVFPWAHLIFTESALLRWRSDFKTDGATRFSEVAGGLNQMTVARFERLVSQSPLRFAWFSAVPIRRLKPLANTLTREFTTAIVRCILEPRSTSSISDSGTHG